MILLYQLAQLILQILWVIIFAQVILSWLLAFNVVNRQSPFVSGLLQGLDRITEPLYRPIRRILPDFGAIDLAPLVVLIAISFLQRSVLPYLLTAALPATV
jgi:YggT family protein